MSIYFSRGNKMYESHNRIYIPCELLLQYVDWYTKIDKYNKHSCNKRIILQFRAM